MPEASVQDNPQFQDAKTRVDAALRASQNAVEVVDERTAERVTGILVSISDVRKRADKLRKEATAPLRDEVSAINAAFTELMAPLKGAEEGLKAQVVQFQRKQQAEAERRRQQAEAEAAERQRKEDQRAMLAGEEPAEVPAARVPKPVPTRRVAAGAVTARKVWKYEVTDEDAVPREFCAPAPGKLAAAVRKGVREIPGVRIYEDDVAAVTRH